MKATSVLFVAFLFFAASCGKTPFPCFIVSEKEDSIPVNKVVYFNAICSDNAKEYFWAFPNDSVAYEEYVGYIFRDTGNAEVSLMVGNGNKTQRMVKHLHVVQ